MSAGATSSGTAQAGGDAGELIVLDRVAAGQLPDRRVHLRLLRVLAEPGGGRRSPYSTAAGSGGTQTIPASGIGRFIRMFGHRAGDGLRLLALRVRGLRRAGHQPVADYQHVRTGNATQNFWRSAENLSLYPVCGTDRWAVAQAAPFRRIDVHGGMTLASPNCGWASGGYIADSRVSGQISPCSQQQWFTRDSTIGSRKGALDVQPGRHRAPGQRPGRDRVRAVRRALREVQREQFHDVLTVSLGKGSITHVINDTSDAALPSNVTPHNVVSYP